jgi:phage gpG-like protein
MQAVAEEYATIVDDQFETEGKAYLSDKWSPLKTKRKRGSRSSAKLLQDTGNLRRGTTYVINGNVVIFTNNIDYAPIHNFGGKVSIPEKVITKRLKSGKLIKYKRKAYTYDMPQRQFLVTSDKAVQQLKDRIADFIEYGE